VPPTAKIFMNNRSQAVRLPKEFQFDTTEVFIRKVGDEVILSPRPEDWSAYLAAGPVASTEFMEGVEDLPVQGASLDAALHAGYRHLFLHPYAVERGGAETIADGSHK